MPKIETVPPGMPQVIDRKMTERTSLAKRHAEALARLSGLADPDRDDAARQADTAARAEVIRSGKPPLSAGTPNTDQLARDRKDAEAEVDAFAAAIATVDDELGEEFAKIAADSKRSGIADTEAARDVYAAALAALPTLRAAFFAGAARTAFVYRAASQLPEDQDGRLKPVPTWLDEAVRPMGGGLPFRLRWHEARSLPPVRVNTISTCGERDYHLAPVTAEKLIRETFGAEVAVETKAGA
jgi:hypothetical protein